MSCRSGAASYVVCSRSCRHVRYYYLLFSPPELISLDEWVFTTEAHPIRVPKNGRWSQPNAANSGRRFWEPNASHVPPAGTYSGGEGGQAGGLTNLQKHIVAAQLAQTKAMQENVQAKVVKRGLELGNDGATAVAQALRKLLETAAAGVTSAVGAAMEQKSAAGATQLQTQPSAGAQCDAADAAAAGPAAWAEPKQLTLEEQALRDEKRRKFLEIVEAMVEEDSEIVIEVVDEEGHKQRIGKQDERWANTLMQAVVA